VEEVERRHSKVGADPDVAGIDDNRDIEGRILDATLVEMPVRDERPQLEPQFLSLRQILHRVDDDDGVLTVEHEDLSADLHGVPAGA
jgi:hypothetical protein